MAMPLIIFALLVLVPIIVTMLLKVNAAILYMSLCVGQVLVQFVASDANSLIVTVSNHGNQLSDSTTRLFLLLIPPVLTLIVMFHSVRGSRLVLNLIPAIGVGLLTPILIKPLLSLSFQHTLVQSSLWSHYANAQTLIVGLSALLALLFLWIGKRSGHFEHSKHKRT